MPKFRYFESVMSLLWKTLTKSERRLDILLVEVNGGACVDPHNKKSEARQDKQLWKRKITFWFEANSHENQIYGSPILLRPFRRDPFQHLARAAASFGFPVSTAVDLSASVPSSVFVRTWQGF